jgi:uncharacterized protein (TIGR02391 family)
MNYEVIAVEVGDALKWDASVRQINRTGKAVFPFSKQTFPNEQITSERAKQVYDWILTLARQRMVSEKREALLIEFCKKATSEELLDETLKILRQNGASPSLLNRENYETFSSRDFHREVVKHARDLFLQSNYFHAVFEAAKAYNKQVSAKAESEEDGQSLMMNVWGCNGTLKITPCESETDRNIQDGIKFLSAGLMRAIRNPTAHEPAVDWPISQQDALDILSFISFLFRKLDDSTYFEA